tara:strand:+ start:3036 stop:3548 length:513 start_codon:yes stop_codon:yes gene_type:complete
MMESLILSLFAIYAHFTLVLPPRTMVCLCGLIFAYVYVDIKLDDLIFKFIGKYIFRKPYFNDHIKHPLSKKVGEFMYRLILVGQLILMLSYTGMTERQFASYQKSIIIVIILLYPIILLNIYASRTVFVQCGKTIDIIYKFYSPKQNTKIPLQQYTNNTYHAQSRKTKLI